MFRTFSILFIASIVAMYYALLPAAAKPKIESSSTQPVATKFARSSTTKPARLQTASFSGGCFWAMEAIFRETPGVIATRVGFSGGHTLNPTYKQVCTGTTGHAETTEIQFDPDQVSYAHLLELFFENHNPTFEHRGGDWTDQCRSIIFVHTPEQKRLAELELEKRKNSDEYIGPILTEILPATQFYSAEAYHQQYVEKQGIKYVCPIGNGKKKR
jgi:peptide-methionine (S)-S-oxide reductase